MKKATDQAKPLGKRNAGKYHKDPDESSEGSLDKKDAEWTPNNSKTSAKNQIPRKRRANKTLTKDQLEGAQKRIFEKIEKAKKTAQNFIKSEPKNLSVRTSVTTTTATGKTRYKGQGTELNPVVILGDPGELVTEVKVASNKFAWEEVV